MQTFETNKMRNVVLVSHSGAGKTSLGESMLFCSGTISRMGRTDNGTTVSDYEPESVKRNSSTQLAVLPCIWRDHKVTIIDTPGYFDFLGDAVSALRVADAAVLLVSASSGVEVGTEQMWKRVKEIGLPCIIVVNKLDRENTDFKESSENVREVLGKNCVPIQAPIGSAQRFTALFNLLDGKDAAQMDLKNEIESAKDLLIEVVAETNDDLATKYLEGEEISSEELFETLKVAVAEGKVCPILGGSALNGLGSQEILDTLLELIPSPADEPAVLKSSESDNKLISPTANAPLEALVFKTTADQFVGKLSFLRIYSGTIQSNSEVYNINKGQSERIGQLFIPRGKDQEPVPHLTTGDIGAVGKLTVTGTGDTLGQKDQSFELSGIEFPHPLYSQAVYPKSKADTDKLSTALNRLVEEDPSLHFGRDPIVGEAALNGLGDVHLEVAAQRALRKFGLNVLLETPKVPYKETLTSITKVEHRYKQQSGGHGHFAHINLRLEPLEHGKGLEFSSEVVGGNVPKDFIPAVEKGVRRACSEGVLAGYPVVDLKAVIYDGSYHPVDSGSMDFDIAGYYGLKKGFLDGSPGLLEPIFSLRVTTPDAYTGEIIGDINGKRGRILGMIPNGDGTSMLEANVPLVEAQRYALDLRSMTQGRATFTMTFDHDEPLPPDLTQHVIDQVKNEKEASK